MVSNDALKLNIFDWMHQFFSGFLSSFINKCRPNHKDQLTTNKNNLICRKRWSSHPWYYLRDNAIPKIYLLWCWNSSMKFTCLGALYYNKMHIHILGVWEMPPAGATCTDSQGLAQVPGRHSWREPCAPTVRGGLGCLGPMPP